MAGRGAFCNGERIRTNAGPAMALQDAAPEEEGEGAAVLGEAVVFAGSPPAVNSMGPSLRGVAALMPKVRTIRMVGSAALMFAWVAAGRASAYFVADLNAWDVAAGAVLIREAGGAIVDMADPYGPPYCLATRRILATNGDPRRRHAILAPARIAAGSHDRRGARARRWRRRRPFRRVPTLLGTPHGVGRQPEGRERHRTASRR